MFLEIIIILFFLIIINLKKFNSMMISITNEMGQILRSNGLDIVGLNRNLPKDFIFAHPSGIKRAQIGQQVELGAYSYIVSGYLCGVTIGNYCSFGRDVQVGRQSHPIEWVSTSPFTYMKSEHILQADIPEHISHKPSFTHQSPATKLKKTLIGHDVWIGDSAAILPGVKIGTGSIIAACSVVTKDVEPYSIVAGNPARKIRNRIDSKYIQSLLESKWWLYSPKQISDLRVDDIENFLLGVRKLGKPDLLPLKRLAEVLSI